MNILQQKQSVNSRRASGRATTSKPNSRVVSRTTSPVRNQYNNSPLNCTTILSKQTSIPSFVDSDDVNNDENTSTFNSILDDTSKLHEFAVPFTPFRTVHKPFAIQEASPTQHLMELQDSFIMTPSKSMISTSLNIPSTLIQSNNNVADILYNMGLNNRLGSVTSTSSTSSIHYTPRVTSGADMLHLLQRNTNTIQPTPATPARWLEQMNQTNKIDSTPIHSDMSALTNNNKAVVVSERVDKVKQQVAEIILTFQKLQAPIEPTIQPSTLQFATDAEVTNPLVVEVGDSMVNTQSSSNELRDIGLIGRVASTPVIIPNTPQSVAVSNFTEQLKLLQRRTSECNINLHRMKSIEFTDHELELLHTSEPALIGSVSRRSTSTNTTCETQKFDEFVAKLNMIKRRSSITNLELYQQQASTVSDNIIQSVSLRTDNTTLPLTEPIATVPQLVDSDVNQSFDEFAARFNAIKRRSSTSNLELYQQQIAITTDLVHSTPNTRLYNKLMQPRAVDTSLDQSGVQRLYGTPLFNKLLKSPCITATPLRSASKSVTSKIINNQSDKNQYSRFTIFILLNSIIGILLAVLYQPIVQLHLVNNFNMIYTQLRQQYQSFDTTSLHGLSALLPSQHVIVHTFDTVYQQLQQISAMEYMGSTSELYVNYFANTQSPDNNAVIESIQPAVDSGHIQQSTIDATDSIDMYFDDRISNYYEQGLHHTEKVINKQFVPSIPTPRVIERVFANGTILYRDQVVVPVHDDTPPHSPEFIPKTIDDMFGHVHDNDSITSAESVAESIIAPVTKTIDTTILIDRMHADGTISIAPKTVEYRAASVGPYSEPKLIEHVSADGTVKYKTNSIHQDQIIFQSISPFSDVIEFNTLVQQLSDEPGNHFYNAQHNIDVATLIDDECTDTIQVEHVYTDGSVKVYGTDGPVQLPAPSGITAKQIRQPVQPLMIEHVYANGDLKIVGQDELINFAHPVTTRVESQHINVSDNVSNSNSTSWTARIMYSILSMCIIGWLVACHYANQALNHTTVTQGPSNSVPQPIVNSINKSVRVNRVVAPTPADTYADDENSDYDSDAMDVGDEDSNQSLYKSFISSAKKFNKTTRTYLSTAAHSIATFQFTVPQHKPSISTPAQLVNPKKKLIFEQTPSVHTANILNNNNVLLSNTNTIQSKPHTCLSSVAIPCWCGASQQSKILSSVIPTPSSRSKSRKHSVVDTPGLISGLDSAMPSTRRSTRLSSRK